jgi:hypothetical protein
MNRLLLLPIKLPLRILALQLRVARGAAELGLDVARELAEAAPWAEKGGGDRVPDAGPAASPAAAETTAPPAAPTPDPAAPAPRAARSPRSGKARASTDGKPASAARPKRATKPKPKPKPPAARGPMPTPEADAPKPRPRRAARKASADKPARRRASEPTRGQAAARRQAARESEASAGEPGPGPELHVAEPWPGYDAMALDEVLGRLQDADETQLAVVALYESQHENRQAILLACETPEP